MHAGRSWAGRSREAKRLWPCICQAKKAEGDAKNGKTFTRNWFSLDQTEGETYAEQVMESLHIEEKRFDMMDGNVKGYALTCSIAVNPLATLQHKTRFHELAHVVLGHTEQAECLDTEALPRHLQEVEAESTAFILCALLDLPGLAESRGYIQSWQAGQELPEKSARHISNVA